jgi:hypothetical protein
MSLFISLARFLTFRFFVEGARLRLRPRVEVARLRVRPLVEVVRLRLRLSLRPLAEVAGFARLRPRVEVAHLRFRPPPPRNLLIRFVPFRLYSLRKYLKHLCRPMYCQLHRPVFYQPCVKTLDPGSLALHDPNPWHCSKE